MEEADTRIDGRHDAESLGGKAISESQLDLIRHIYEGNSMAMDCIKQMAKFTGLLIRGRSPGAIFASPMTRNRPHSIFIESEM
jgi:hypothetical protein